MGSKLEIIVITFTVIRIIFAIEYRSSLQTQKIIHYENSYVDFGVKYYGSEGYPYIILKDVVTPYDDLHLMLYLKIYDKPPKLLVNAPLSLCQLLHDENIIKNQTIAQYNIPQIFGFSGKRCPIEEGKIKLPPYIFPSTFFTDIDLGCGVMNLEARLMKCDLEGDNRQCETLLKTVSLANFVNDHCENEEVIKHDGWVLKMITFAKLTID